MNLTKLQIIELIEKYKKVTSVAAVLNLKQPTVTFHMKNLEQAFGVQLFESQSGRIFLTEAGQSLLHYAAKINSLAREAERVVKEYDSLNKGHLKIGASYVPGTYILPRVLNEFAQKHPQIQVSLSIKPTPVIKELLTNHQIDLGIVSAESFQLAALTSEALCADELVVIFSPQHRFAGYPELYPAQIAETPFLLHGLDSSTRQLTDKWAQSNRVNIQSQIELDSLEVIKQIAKLGDTISFVSQLAIKNELERGELLCRRIPGNTMSRHVYYAYNPDRRRSAVWERFIAHLTDTL